MAATPPIVSRAAYKTQRDALLAREKAHTREGDAIASARRHLPMVEVPASTPLIGSNGATSLLAAFEGRTQLFASYHMWHTGLPAADQCEGCTFFTGSAGTEFPRSYLNSRDVTIAVFSPGPFEEGDRYRKFMGWEGLQWYEVPEGSVEGLHAVSKEEGRGFGMKVCYLRVGERVFETYWSTSRGVEGMAGAYAVLDMMVYGRREVWEESPEGWPKEFGTASEQFREVKAEVKNLREGVKGRPIPQWPRIEAGHDDDLGTSGVAKKTEQCCN